MFLTNFKENCELVFNLIQSKRWYIMVTNVFDNVLKKITLNFFLIVFFS